MQEFHGKGFREAVEYLLDFNGRARDSPAPRRPPVKEERPEFVLPPANADQRRVFAYLRKRGIAPQVIQGFIDAGLLYEDAEHHNCVFVGRDGDGKPVFASKRGTYDKDGVSFKRDVLGSDKSVAFRLSCDPTLDWVAVFEAPIGAPAKPTFRLRGERRSSEMSEPCRLRQGEGYGACDDAMSFCTLHRAVTSNAVALCGLYQGPLDTYLRENPHLKRIVLCLDTDRPGREAAERFRQEYTQKGYAVSIRLPARGKDWNECLQQRSGAKERGDQHQTAR